MKQPLYHIDAFAERPFEGNPAAVCPLATWLDDELMQAIAAENNVSETAFFVKTPQGYRIRWFSPVAEVDLCGHATLASAFVLFNYLSYPGNEVRFESNSGVLSVKREGDRLEMDFPAQPAVSCPLPDPLRNAFDREPLACLRSQDYVVVFADETEVKHMRVDFSLLAELDLRGVAITSQAKDYDFVSRFFAPKYGIDEDPVTGSSFTQLIPYWSQRLNKRELTAKQVSSRGGEIEGVYLGNRVLIRGKAVLYMIGTLEI